MDKHSCLDLLGLDETATEVDIKKAYKAIALKTHPDKLVDLSDEEKEDKEMQFKQVSEAYKRLLDNNFYDDIFDGYEDIFGGSGMANMFGGGESFKMFSGMASKIFQSQSFQHALQKIFSFQFHCELQK